MFQKIVLLVAISVCLGLGVYFRFFRRPPTADILAANLQLHSGTGGDDVSDDDNDDADDPSKHSQKIWDRWIKINKYVAIGKLYDKCEGDDRLTVGRVIMLQDHVNGGVTSKTFLNITLDDDVTGGLMSLQCKYNNNDLYSNHWELCSAEDGMDDRIVFCPVRAGRRKFVKQLKIPNYLPKGHYSTKAWMLDQNGKGIGCAFVEFTL